MVLIHLILWRILKFTTVSHLSRSRPHWSSSASGSNPTFCELESNTYWIISTHINTVVSCKKCFCKKFQEKIINTCRNHKFEILQINSTKKRRKFWSTLYRWGSELYYYYPRDCLRKSFWSTSKFLIENHELIKKTLWSTFGAFEKFILIQFEIFQKFMLENGSKLIFQIL